MSLLSRSYPALRRLLFLLDPEAAHHLSFRCLRLAERAGLLALLAPSLPARPVRCMGLDFPHPVGLAAGLDKNADTIDALGRLGFSFIEAGTLTPRPQPGNPLPRLFRLPEKKALINRMGFNNPGVHEGVANARKSRSFRGPLGINIGKNKDTPNEDAASDYLAAYRAAYPAADYIAANLSSPNTPGLRDLQAAGAAARLVEALKKEQEALEREHGKTVPLALKVAPDLADEDIPPLAQAFLDTGLDALIATNTTIDRAAVQGHPRAAEAGGLSGAPLAARSTQVLAAFHSALGGRIPLIASGGIMTAADARSKIDAGATLLQLYTGFIYSGPRLIEDILASLPGND